MQTPNGLSPFHLIFNLWMLWTVFSKSAAAEAVEEKPNLAKVQEPPSTSTETDIDVLQDKLLETANFSWLLGLLGENEKWPLMKQLEEGEEEEYPSCSEKELQAADRRCIDQVVATAHLLHLPPHPNQMALFSALFNLINSGQNDKRKKVGCHGLEQYLACLVDGRCSRCSYPEATVADFARIRFLSAYSSRCPESFPDDVHHLLQPKCSASTWGTFHPKTGPAPGSCLSEAQKMACYGRVYPPNLGSKVKNWEEAFYRVVTAVLYDQKEAGHRESCERLLKLGKCQLEVACKGGGGGGGDHHSQKSSFCSEAEVDRLKSLFRFLLSYHRRRQISSNDGGGGEEHNWANCLDKGWVNLEQLEEVVTESCPKNPKTTLSSTTTTNSNSTTTTSTKKWSSTNKKPHPHHHRKTSTSDSSDSEKNDHHHHPHHHHHRHSSTTSPLKILIIVGWSLLAFLLVGLLLAYCCLCTERKRRQQKKMRDFYAAAQKDGGKPISSGDKSNKSSLGLNRNSRNYSEDGGGEVGASVSFVVFSKSKSVLPGSAASSQQALGGKKSKKVLPPTSASKASSSSGVPPASPGGGGGGGKVPSLIGGKGGGGKSNAAKTSGKVFAGKSKLGASKK